MLFLLAVVALAEHLRAYELLRGDVLPTAVLIPALQQRERILQEQLEIAEVQATFRTGSQEELLRTYVIPGVSDRERLLRFLEAVRDSLQGRGLLSSMSAVSFGEIEAITLEGVSLSSLPLMFTVTVTSNGAQELFTVLRASGMVVLGDALTREEQRELLRHTEAENPAAVMNLEQFLASDLLRYAREPQPHHEQLRKAFVSEVALESLEHLLSTSFLADVRALLGGPLGKALEQKNAWPMRYLALDAVEQQFQGENEVHLAFALHALTRAAPSLD
jgi:hypothetical protein